MLQLILFGNGDVRYNPNETFEVLMSYSGLYRRRDWHKNNALLT